MCVFRNDTVRENNIDLWLQFNNVRLSDGVVPYKYFYTWIKICFSNIFFSRNNIHFISYVERDVMA